MFPGGAEQVLGQIWNPSLIGRISWALCKRSPQASRNCRWKRYPEGLPIEQSGQLTKGGRPEERPKQAAWGEIEPCRAVKMGLAEVRRGCLTNRERRVREMVRLECGGNGSTFVTAEKQGMQQIKAS